MKELFRKLSSLFKFPKEDRLVNAGPEGPDMSGPKEDPNINPLETETDESGPELEGEGTLEEKTAREAEFKLAEARDKVKKGAEELKKGEKELVGKWEKETDEEGAKRLLAEQKAKEKELFPWEHAEDKTREKIATAKLRERFKASKELSAEDAKAWAKEFKETPDERMEREMAKEVKITVGPPTITPVKKGPLPAKAEYARIERDEASKGREVEPELPPLVPIAEQLDLTVKEGYEDAVKDMLFGRQEKQDMAGTDWEDTMKFFKVLKESGDMDALVKRAEELHDAGNTEDIESFEFWVDKYVRDATKKEEYNEEEKEEISGKMKKLVADFAPRKEEVPVQVAEAEIEEEPLTEKQYDELLAELDAAAKGAGEEWEGEPPEDETKKLLKEIDMLRAELAREKEEKEPAEWARPEPPDIPK